VRLLDDLDATHNADPAGLQAQLEEAVRTRAASPFWTLRLPNWGQPCSPASRGFSSRGSECNAPQVSWLWGPASPPLRAPRSACQRAAVGELVSAGIPAHSAVAYYGRDYVVRLRCADLRYGLPSRRLRQLYRFGKGIGDGKDSRSRCPEELFGRAQLVWSCLSTPNSRCADELFVSARVV
jgi:hypothetical protein